MSDQFVVIARLPHGSKSNRTARHRKQASATYISQLISTDYNAHQHTVFLKLFGQSQHFEHNITANYFNIYHWEQMTKVDGDVGPCSVSSPAYRMGVNP